MVAPHRDNIRSQTVVGQYRADLGQHGQGGAMPITLGSATPRS
jgi:hypothetical protein